MIKRMICILFLIITVKFDTAQARYIDSLQNNLKITQNDTMKLMQLIALAEVYSETKPDSSFYFTEQLLTVSQKLKFRLHEAYAYSQMAYALLNMGNYPRSLQILLS